MTRGDRRRCGGDRTQAVLVGAERAAPSGDARGRRAGGGVGRAGGAVEVPVVSAARRRLHVERVVDEDFRRSLRHRRRRVGERVPWRGRGWAGKGSVKWGAVVKQRSMLVSGHRRKPGRDGWRAVTHGAQLEHRNQTKLKHQMQLSKRTENRV